jgi:hypothetical protein
MTHKIIFLDLPHVLVVGGKVSPSAVAVLNDLTDGTGADLVLLPTWPDELLFADIRAALAEIGVTANIVSCCPCVPAFGRAGEVQMWLDEHRWHVAVHIILSTDDGFAEEFGNRLVLVDDPLGLTPEIATKAAQALGL